MSTAIHKNPAQRNVSDCKSLCSNEIKALFNEWIANRENTLKTKEIADKLIPLMEKCGSSFSASLSETATGSFLHICKQLLELRHSLVKKSQWIFGGDGWGYDIGFGGLDHVLASGEDVCQRLRTPLNKSNEVSNVVVVDTEVYSNTGGQSSKATPAGAVAKFATSGKKIRKKDLGMIAKSLCRPGRYGSFAGPVLQRHQGGRGLPRPVALSSP